MMLFGPGVADALKANASSGRSGKLGSVADPDMVGSCLEPAAKAWAKKKPRPVRRGLGSG
jgi:hypothetical protein